VLASAALTVTQVIAYENQPRDLVVVAGLGQSADHEFADPGFEPSEQPVEVDDAIGMAFAVVHLRRTGTYDRRSRASPPEQVIRDAPFGAERHVAD
jgi:hypothetical protein